MPVSLEFASSHHYHTVTDGIEVPIALRTGNQSVDFVAKVDTGATHCILIGGTPRYWGWMSNQADSKPSGR
jgi:hypothetical protein